MKSSNLAVFVVVNVVAGVVYAADPTWTVVVDHPNQIASRSTRGLALNGDATSIYTTTLDGSSTAEVRSYTLSGAPPIATFASGANISGFTGTPPAINTQAEAAVVDDRGLVFAAIVKDSTSDENSKIAVFSPSLGANQLFELPKITAGNSSETIGGIDFRLSGGVRQLYVARHLGSTAYVERYVINGADLATTSLTADTTFDGDGRFDLKTLNSGSSYLRGIDVADDGTIFIASRENNVVYKLNGDLSALATQSVSNAMDIALFGGEAYVTQYAGSSSAIQVLNVDDLAPVTNFTATADFAHGSGGGYAGIDVDSTGRLYISDQFYGGTTSSLSDRILVSSAIPEPATLGLIGLGGLLLGRRRR